MQKACIDVSLPETCGSVVDWGLARDEHRYVSIRGETAHKRRAWDIKRIESLLEGGTGGGEPGLAVVRAAAEQ